MERLVKNGKIILNGDMPLYEKERIAFNKLEMIENIEEALENGIYFKRGKRTVYAKIDITDLDTEKFNIFNTKKWEWEKYYFKDYGKTWSLKKEEL